MALVNHNRLGPRVVGLLESTGPSDEEMAIFEQVASSHCQYDDVAHLWVTVDPSCLLKHFSRGGETVRDFMGPNVEAIVLVQEPSMGAGEES